VAPTIGELISTVLSEISSTTLCRFIQSIPRMTSMPSNLKMIRSVSTVLLPNSKGTPLVTNSEEMFLPAVLIVNASLVLQEFSPTLLSVFPFMKLCVAPESNNTQIGLPRIENVPIITSAPPGISPIEVKLSLPLLAWATFFLPLLMGLETCLWLGWVSWCCLLVWQGYRHALAKCPGSPHLNNNAHYYH
jgi:hypothetical protein